MKNKKNFFEIAIGLLIFCIVFSTAGFFFYAKTMFKSIDEINFIYLFILSFVQFILILLIIKRNYSYPIDELNEVIRKFMSGNSKGKEININKNYFNPKIKFTMTFLDFILNSIKNIKDEFMSGKAIKSEVQLATELQDKLLHKKLEVIPSLDVVAKSRPAGEIGGDSYDVIKEGSNYYIYVGDATGHGVGAGFVMVMVNALISGFAKIFKSGSQILGFTNEILKPRIKSNILMTLLMIRWDEVEKRLFMTGAGHEYLIIYKHSLNKCFMVKSGGMALGMTKNIHKILKEQEIKFEQDDILVLYTDGITEAINQNKKDGFEEMFGEKRITKAIETAPNLPGEKFKSATSVFNSITIELSKFMGYKHKQYDDITLVVIHNKGDRVIQNDFSKDIDKDFITEWYW